MLLRICTMSKFPLVLAALLTGALAAHADNLVSTQPSGSDSVDWSQLGSPGTTIGTTFAFTSAQGVAGTGVYANPGDSMGVYSQPGEVGAILQQSSTWNGSFAPGAYLNWTENSGPLTLTLASGYTEIGAQIEADFWGAYTAQICDANGCFTESGVNEGAGDNSAIYLGIDSSTPINSVTFSLTSAVSDPDDFAISGLTLDSGSSATPEPSSLILLGTGLVAFAGAMRRKLARQA
jgi:hypothetical protein